MPVKSCPWSPKVRAGRLQNPWHQAARQGDGSQRRHPCPHFPVEVLAKLKPVYEGGVQTGGNSSALVDAAAACGGVGQLRQGPGQTARGPRGGRRCRGRAARNHGHRPRTRHPLLLERTGLKLDDIRRFEINEAQGAQTLPWAANWAWTSAA